MAAPTAPTIDPVYARPDPRRPILLRKSAFAGDAGDLAAPVYLYPTDVPDEDTTAGPTWVTGEAGLKDNTDHKQSLMASAATAGKSNRLVWSGGSFGVTTSLEVYDLTYEIGAMATWDSTFSDPGDVRVSSFLAHDDGDGSDELQRIDTLHRGAQWTGSTAASSVVMKERSILSALLARQSARRFTVAEVEALFANLTVDVVANVQYDTRPPPITSWYAGPARLRLDYYSSAPRHQSAVRWQVATDAAFSSVVWDSDTGGRIYAEDDVVSIPAETLTGGVLYYVRAMVWDDAVSPAASAWSATVTFTTMGEGASILINAGPRARVQPIVNIWARHVVAQPRWSRHVAAGVHSVYRAPLDRSTVANGEQGFRLADFEEEGSRARATEVLWQGTAALSIAAVEATAGTWWWDEEDDAGLGEPHLFVHTTDSRNPGAYRSSMLCLLLDFGFSTDDVPSTGPGGVYDYEGRVREPFPRIVESIATLEQAIRPTPSGDLVLDNSGSLFDRLLTRGGPNAPGLILERVPVFVRYVGGRDPQSLATWDDPLGVWEFVGSWSPRSLHRGTTVAMRLEPVSSHDLETQLASDVYDAAVWPALLSSVEGRTIPEYYGERHQRRPLAVVDTAAHRLHVGRRVFTVSDVYKDGAVVATSKWSYDSTHEEVAITDAAIWDEDAEWTADLDGEAFEGSAQRYPGDLARLLMTRRGGVRAADIADGSFDAIDLPFALASQDCRFHLDSAVSLLDVLQVVERTGVYSIVRRIDDTWVALPEFPTEANAGTVVIQDADLVEPVTSHYDAEHTGGGSAVTYYGYPDPDTPLAAVNTYTWDGRAQYRREDVRAVETYHATRGGAVVVRNNTKRVIAYRDYRLNAGWAGAGVQVGGTVLLNLLGRLEPDGDRVSDVLSADGYLEWDLCRVIEREVGGYMIVRHLKRLPADEVPD